MRWLQVRSADHPRRERMVDRSSVGNFIATPPSSRLVSSCRWISRLSMASALSRRRPTGRLLIRVAECRTRASSPPRRVRGSRPILGDAAAAAAVSAAYAACRLTCLSPKGARWVPEVFGRCVDRRVVLPRIVHAVCRRIRRRRRLSGRNRLSESVGLVTSRTCLGRPV